MVKDSWVLPYVLVVTVLIVRGYSGQGLHRRPWWDNTAVSGCLFKPNASKAVSMECDYSDIPYFRVSLSSWLHHHSTLRPCYPAFRMYSCSQRTRRGVISYSVRVVRVPHNGSGSGPKSEGKTMFLKVLMVCLYIRVLSAFLPSEHPTLFFTKLIAAHTACSL